MTLFRNCLLSQLDLDLIITTNLSEKDYVLPALGDIVDYLVSTLMRLEAW